VGESWARQETTFVKPTLRDACGGTDCVTIRTPIGRIDPNRVYQDDCEVTAIDNPNPRRGETITFWLHDPCDTSPPTP
ncbi:MAG: hypothetical protein WCG47_26120, partial [Dermatophilaceae bacterium]